MPPCTNVTPAQIEAGLDILRREFAQAWHDLPEEPDVDYAAVAAFLEKHSTTARYEPTAGERAAKLRKPPSGAAPNMGLCDAPLCDQ
jgi:hypothetical protein